MAQLDIYTKPWCPYCGRATNLLRRKGLSFNEINVAVNPHLEDEMKSRSHRHTVPQIFINGVHVGGSDDLISAENNGLLDSLLASEIETNPAA